MEPRLCLAITLSGGIITVIGERNAAIAGRGDGVRVTLKQHAYRVALNQTAATFRSADVSGLFIDLGGGDDHAAIAGVLIPVTIIGGNGNDTLVGGVANDSMSGGAGNDHLAAGLGDDQMDGGVGLDLVDYSDRSDSVIIALTGEPSGATGEADTLTDIEEVFGGNGDDVLLGNEGANFLTGGRGNDTLYGGSGNDQLLGGPGRDVMFGNEGDDFLLAQDQEQDIVIGGGTGIDFDLAQVDPIDRGLLNGDVAELDPTQSLDPLPLVVAASVTPGLLPAAASDPTKLHVSGDVDTGGQQVADSILLTQNGNVITLVQNGRTQTFDARSLTSITIDAGGGNDTIALQQSDGSLGVTIPALISGGNGKDTIVGSNADDTIVGSGGNDLINGGLGNDSLFGGAGNDTLLGGRGLDLLNGGHGTFSSGGDGADVLDGGRDEDTADYAFRLDALNISLDDSANDGAAGESDQILAVENVFSGNGSDLIVGNASRNLISGSGGQDTINAMDGTDVILGSRQTDTMIGGPGIDIIFALDGKRDEITPGQEGPKFTRSDRTDFFP